jgi:histidine triad (HIT) family protein
MDCIFCKIVNGQIPAKFVYQDEKVLAFADLYPKAPVHKLIIPKKHIATINDLSDEDRELISHLIFVAKKIARDLKIAESGYRLLFNCNHDGGQEIYHLHLHLLGGKKLHWPLD